jgi:hypothetical protein
MITAGTGFSVGASMTRTKASLESAILMPKRIEASGASIYRVIESSARETVTTSMGI